MVNFYDEWDDPEDFDMEDEWMNYGDKDGKSSFGTWTPFDSVLEDFDMFGEELFNDYDF